MATPIRDTLAHLGRSLLSGLARGSASDSFPLVQDVINRTAVQRKEIQKLRDFFEGNQIRGTGLRQGETYVPTWPDESSDELTVRANRMESIKWNRIRDGVLTHTDALYAWGKGRAISRSIDWSEVEGDIPQDWWEDYYRRRFLRKNAFPVLAWQTWAAIGAERQGLLMLRWLDSSNDRMTPFESADRDNHLKDGVVWAEPIDNLTYVALPHPDQTTTLGTVIRWYLDPDATQSIHLPSEMTAEPGASNTITELITDKLWIRWRGKTIIPTLWGTENRYGDVRTVFVWGRNPLDLADSDDALEAQTQLNEHMYSGSEIKRQHAFPETLYRGYEPPMTTLSDGTKVLVRGPNVAHVAEDPNADIIKRSPETGIGDIGIAEAEIHQMLDDALGLSQTDRGVTSGLGQMRSAPAISRFQAKSERRRQRKLLFADQWEQAMFRAMVNMTAYHAYGPATVADHQDMRMTVVFPDDAFMLDPSTETQKDALELQSGMTDRETVVRKRHPEASDDEISEILGRIDSEQKETQNMPLKQDPTPQDASDSQKNS